MKTERAIAEFIDYKRSLGRRYASRAIILRAFARVAGGSDIRKVTPDIVRKFIDGRGPVTNAWFARFSTLNCLFRYALSRNYIADSPLPKLKPPRPVEFRPYIYSAADVKKLLDAAESRHRSSWRLAPRTIRVLLLLLYGTGLRISEAVALKIADVDLKALILTIRETKFFKTRLVPDRARAWQSSEALFPATMVRLSSYAGFAVLGGDGRNACRTAGTRRIPREE